MDSESLERKEIKVVIVKANVCWIGTNSNSDWEKRIINVYEEYIPAYSYL